jgi:transcriptional regulator with XRE-family HTH domain
MNESLSEYVNRIIKQKGLTQKDVADRSGNIAKGYVSEISSGKVTNLSTDKLQELAKGLDVDVMELCAIACGAEYSATGFDPLVFLDLMEKVLVEPDLAEILKNLCKLTKTERQAILEMTQTLARKKKQKPRAS